MDSQSVHGKEFVDGDDDDLATLLPKNEECDTVEKQNVNGAIPKQTVKRRKTAKETNETTTLYTDIFLKIIYPLSGFLEKNITVGFFKSLDFMPGVLLNHQGKSIVFCEGAWNSFTKNMSLIECYMLNKVYGKKTSIRLASSDIEVENVKFRCTQCVRFRNLSKHDEKIVLSGEEFFTMMNVAPAVNRYLQQLMFSVSVIKEYLVDTIHTQPNAPLIYGPVDTSIYNRLPQEVSLYRNQSKVVNTNTDVDGGYDMCGYSNMTQVGGEEECSDEDRKPTHV